MKRLSSLAISVATAALALAGASVIAQDKMPLRPSAKGNWGAAIERKDGGHLLGNPQADLKLVEYMSYTCSHCAEFARQGEGAIKLVYVPTGKVSFEIRHLLRDPVDLTATMLTHCGDPKKFAANHAAIILRQDEWFAKARSATQAQRARWQFGTNSSRRQAIASDLGFYEIMENRGYSRPDLNRCLADEGKAEALAETSMRDVETHGLQGTPSFLINGDLLSGVHAWPQLQKALDSRL